MRNSYGWLVALALIVASSVGQASGERDVGDRSELEMAVTAFYSGLAAMEMGLFERARNDLERAATRLPDEPAVPADMGVLAMRRGDDDAAREHLQRARALAPDSAGIAFLSGLLARRVGNTDGAVDSFRRAIENDPKQLKPRYALATTLEERASRDDRPEVQGLITGLLQDDPDNPVLRLRQIRLLAEAGQVAPLREAVEQLEATAAGWPAAAQDQLARLREAVGEPGRAAVASRVLGNVLLRTPSFRDGLARLQVPAQLGAEPIRRFLQTPVPPSKPAALDRALRYTPRPMPPDGPGGFLVLPVEGAGALVRAAEAGLSGGNVITVEGLAGAIEADQTVAVDLFNNGRLDVVVAAGNGLQILRQKDEGVFRAFDPGLPGDITGGAYFGAWTADLELDGDMDLVLGAERGEPIVLRNNGDGSFIPRELFRKVDGLRDFVWADMDGDGLPDVATLDDAGTVHRFRNARAGSYVPEDDIDGSYVAIAVADLSWDGRMDLVALAANGVLTSWSGGEPRRRGQWPDIESPMEPGQAALFAADLDNNGAVDLLASMAGDTHIWLTDATGRQTQLSSSLPWQVTAITDWNGDGLLDLVGLDEQDRWLQLAGQGDKSYGWQAIRPRALDNAGDNRINTFALGGQVELRAGLLVQRQLIDSPVMHFGLGEQDSADVAWLLWPNGTSQAEFDLEPQQTVEAVQRLKGSCPWVFTNDGNGMRFVTDFLWRSPLGMRVNAVDTATITQTEDRVKIPGDVLVADNGEYEIRITAELWETHFIDAVALVAVDHPAGTSVFVDERFSRAPPDFEPVTTGPPQPVARVQDHRGTDWTAAARALDGRYIAGLALGRYQGIAAPHYVEIDLPAAPSGDDLVLLASGWVYPTDSSINVAVAQGGSVRPRGLSLEVPNDEGEWVTVREDLGFPAGKHKTMVIDLQGVFRPGAPRRLRLTTNLEIYWDRLAVAERRVAKRSTGNDRGLAIKTATLRYRGFSETSQPTRSMPEVPRYDRLQGIGQRWPDLAGYYTRFGNVRELLAHPDDRYVIMNAGDELVLRFDAPAPAEGMARDFILVGHGWVKDGDYNTAFSRTVLPLPSREWSTYDTPPTTLEADPVYQRHAGDWRRFHTRYVSPSRFLSGLRD